MDQKPFENQRIHLHENVQKVIASPIFKKNTFLTLKDLKGKRKEKDPAVSLIVQFRYL